MSGGHFDYSQFKLDDMAEEIASLVPTNSVPDENGYIRGYSGDTLSRFYEAVWLLKLAGIYIHYIDYLICGDIDEDAFPERLKEDITELYEETKEKFRCVGRPLRWGREQ